MDHDSNGGMNILLYYPLMLMCVCAVPLVSWGDLFVFFGFFLQGDFLRR